MVFLKVSAIVLGLMSVSSVNVNLTPMPSMDDCIRYLNWEYNDTQKRTSEMKLTMKDSLLNMEFKGLFFTYSGSYECIEVK